MSSVTSSKPALSARDLRFRPATTLVLAVVCAVQSLAAQGTRGITPASDANLSAQLGSYHALLIAVQNYSDPAVPPLDNPVRDARALRDVLVSRYRFDAKDVDLLESPTRETILSKLYELSERLGDNDNLLIFFAGHGYWDERGEQGYWLPADARRSNNAHWISNSTIGDELKRIGARHVLVVSDACFSGGIFRMRDFGSADTPSLARLYQHRSRKAMTSGSREIVPDRSQFLKYLVKALRDNSEPLVAASDLFFRGVRGPVMNNSTVTPQYGLIHGVGDEDGEFIFALRDAVFARPSASAPPPAAEATRGPGDSRQPAPPLATSPKGDRVASSDPRSSVTGPRFLVPAFQSSERGLGVQAAETIRERMGRDFELKTLWIIPTTDVMTALVSSGFSTAQALSADDGRVLAKNLRAEEYVEGNVEKSPTGFRIAANLTLVAPAGMVQPLPPIEASRLEDGAKQVSQAIEAARRQLSATMRCIELFRAKNYAGALGEALKGIAAYPNAVMPRVCMAEVYNEQKLGADSMIAISEQILAIHPDNKRALAFAADAYREKKNEDKHVRALTRLVVLDPKNARLQAQVVNILAGSGRVTLALPIVDDAVKNNPGDATLVKLQWLVHFAANDIKGALVIGEEMVKLDPASADTSFFIRQSAAYAADSQFNRAAQTLASGRQKFPNNMSIGSTYVQLLIQTGQTKQAIDEAKPVLAVNPKIRGIWLPIAKVQSDAGAPPDTVMASLRAAIAAGDSAGIVATYATGLGQAEQKKALPTKDVEGFRRALTFLQFSDSVQQTPAAAFLQGATHLQKGQALLEQARDKKSCDMAKEAAQDFSDAQIFIPRGAAQFRNEAGQLMMALQQLSPYGDQTVKALCKGK
jgi:tetratricopeptide (TPR) repeat protein